MSNSKSVKQSRTFVTFICCIMAMVTCPYLLPGITVTEPMQAVAAGTLLGLAYLVIRPVMRLLTLPLGCLTLGLFNLVIDVGLIYLSASFVEGFHVPSLLYALLTALLINAICAVVAGRK